MRFNVLSDGPFRYIHSTETGELLLTLVREQDGKFSDDDSPDQSAHRTIRQWKAILSRRVDARELDTSHL